MIGDELGARTGRAWLVRLVLLAAVAVVGPRLARRASEGRREALLPAAVVGGLALLATITVTGHATSGDLVGLAVVTDLVHLSAVSVWLGGLALLLGAVLWPADGVGRPDGEGGGLLAVLADGMGGHTGGAVAGQTACSTFAQVFSTATSAYEERLQTALDAVGKVAGAVGPHRDVLDGHRPAGVALHVERALLPLEVGH